MSLLLGAGTSCGAAGESGLEITYRLERLDNGLTVIIHEDHKAPVVAVNVWYRVGSRDERVGKTGLAHLFEHLMFNGSEHFNDDWFKALEKVGASELNGTTSQDRTNYFQVVPRDALDFTLWMESDRMGHLLGALTQERLEEQQGVVINEKHQYDNQPYNLAWRLITHNTWPAGHPYSWEVIGSEEDIAGVTLEDARSWFKSHYGAANAVVVIAGDVESEEALEKVKCHFGFIPAGPPVTRHKTHIVKMQGTRRMTAQDHVPQPRLYMVWNTPNYGSRESALLGVTARMLAIGRSSRLYKRLVREEALATDVSAWSNSGDIAGQFFIIATVKPGVEVGVVEGIVAEEMVAFLESGPRVEELNRVKASVSSDFIRGCERVGGFGGKSDVLARNYVFTGDPAYHKTLMEEVDNATVEQIREVASAWLDGGCLVLHLLPFPACATTAQDVDRTVLPVPELKPESRFPAVTSAKLANGLGVRVATRHETPLVQVELLVKAGYADDPQGASGVAAMTTAMLEEGAKGCSSLELSEKLELLGARLWSNCRADAITLSLSAPASTFPEAMELFVRLVVEPAFRSEDFERVRRQQVAAIQREKLEPHAMARRIMPTILYGAGHPYSKPWSGRGIERDVAGMRVDQVVDFHRKWFFPANAALLVAGDIEVRTLQPQLDDLSRRWLPEGAVERTPPPRASVREGAAIYLVDKPGAQQSMICAASLTVPVRADTEPALEVANAILGGSFTSRINMNIREEKHWSYGVRSSFSDMPGQRAFVCMAPVQQDKTVDALRELQREFQEFVGAKPPTAEECATAQRDRALRITGRWETLGAVVDTMVEMERFELPESYYGGYAEVMLGMDAAAVRQAGAQMLDPAQLVWLVIGDKDALDSALRAAEIGQVRVIEMEEVEGGGVYSEQN